MLLLQSLHITLNTHISLMSLLCTPLFFFFLLASCLVVVTNAAPIQEPQLQLGLQAYYTFDNYSYVPQIGLCPPRNDIIVGSVISNNPPTYGAGKFEVGVLFNNNQEVCTLTQSILEKVIPYVRIFSCNLLFSYSSCLFSFGCVGCQITAESSLRFLLGLFNT